MFALFASFITFVSSFKINGRIGRICRGYAWSRRLYLSHQWVRTCYPRTHVQKEMRVNTIYFPQVSPGTIYWPTRRGWKNSRVGCAPTATPKFKFGPTDSYLGIVLSSFLYCFYFFSFTTCYLFSFIRFPLFCFFFIISLPLCPPVSSRAPILILKCGRECACCLFLCL